VTLFVLLADVLVGVDDDVHEAVRQYSIAASNDCIELPHTLVITRLHCCWRYR
jgi:hypothetical protein